METTFQQVPFWSLFERTKRLGFPEEELLSVYREYGVIRKDDRDDNHNRPGNDLAAYQLVEQGDLVLNKMKTWQGSLGVSPFRGIVSPAYFVYRALTNNDSRFLHYALRSPRYIKYYAANSKGVRPGQWDLQPEQLDVMKVALPPLDTQRAIADYLDRETSEIDAMLDKLDGLGRLLEERRQNLIDQLTWHQGHPIGSLKLDASFVTSGSRGWSGYYADSGERFLRITDLSRGTYRFDDSLPQHVSLPDDVEGARTLTQEGDLLFSITAYLGSIAVVDEEHESCYTSQHVGLLRLRGQLYDPYFVAYCVLSPTGQRNISQDGLGGTKVGLVLDDLLNLRVPLPDLDEQRRVVEHLDETTARIDAMMSKVGALKSLLTERRSALITAAVTGQIELYTQCLQNGLPR